MYLGSWKIDDLVTFTCNTHRVDTGEATDADSVPTYRVYEDETGTAILTGSMALLDSSNTAGFYSEQITLSAANGFEKGKSYNVYISATVNGVTGTMNRFLQIEAEVDANIVSDKTGYTVSTVSDKTGYSLSSAGIQAMWDALTSALTTVGSIGKLLVDNINAAISSRLASASYTAPLDAAGTRSAVGLATANLDTQLDALPTASENATAVLSAAASNPIDANVQEINDTALTGDGSTTPWGPA